MSHASLSRDIRIGHVHLRVADLERSTAFYRDVLGFRVTIDGPAVGVPTVFLAAGDYHHHITLNGFGGPGAPPAPARYSGLYHFALLYPGPLALADAVARVYHHRYPINHAADHGLSVSLYLEDPDGNGVELYCDRPRSYWFDEEGRPIVKSEPFDPLDLLQVLLSWPEAA